MRTTLAFLVAFVMVTSGCGGPGVTSSGPTSTADGHSVDVKVSDASARLVVGELLRVASHPGLLATLCVTLHSVFLGL